jgi:hypothetical protein
MQHGFANWFLAVASGLPPYIKGEEREYRVHKKPMKLYRHGGLRDAGHEVGK